MKIVLTQVFTQVPVGLPEPAAEGSSFGHDEFLVYKENQQRIRFILTFQFNPEEDDDDGC